MPALKIYIHSRKRTVHWKDLCQNVNRRYFKMVRLYVVLFFSLTYDGFEVRRNQGSSPGSPTYQLCDLGQFTLSNP